MAPPSRLSLSQWADEYRRLSAESSAEPGRWDTGRAEYQRGMMDAFTDRMVERIVLKTSARVGKTQCLNNIVGFCMHQDPSAMLFVLPTETRAEEWADDELDPMIRDTPALRDVLGERKSRAAKQRRLHRNFPGGRLYVVGANAPSGLAAKTVRVVLQDEIDRFPASAGTEGDPVTLAEKRAATIWNRKLILSSTPTIEGQSRIEAAYEASDQRRFFVPCGHCGDFQTLRWERVQWTSGAPETAAYYCEGCGVPWSEDDRHEAVRRGEWRATAPFHGVAGFHLSELYSPWRKLVETVRAFEEAKKLGLEGLKVFRNTALGETWQEAGDAPEWRRLYDRREEWEPGTIPDGVVFLTAGMDVQRDRVEISVYGWGGDRRRWLIEHRVIDGNPFEADIWNRAAEFLAGTYPHESGHHLPISMTAVDSGDGVTTALVYRFVKRLGAARAVAVKGTDGMRQPIGAPGRTEVQRRGRRIGGLKVYPVGSSYLKGELYGVLRLDRPTVESGEPYPAGFVFLPMHAASEEFCRQLTAEHIVARADRRGFRRVEWVKTRERNEALDCAVYARAAASHLGMDQWSADRWVEMASRLSLPPSPAPEPEPEQDEDEVLAPAPVMPTIDPMRRPAPAQTRPNGWFGGRQGGGWIRR